MNALVVDDSAAMRRIAARALEALGWRVREAAGTDEALALLEADPACELLLTDWHMPGADGLELARRVRRGLRPAGLRIVVLTSDAVLASAAAALEAGADDLLMKPFTRAALEERIAEVMRA